MIILGTKWSHKYIFQISKSHVSLNRGLYSVPIFLIFWWSVEYNIKKEK